LTEKQHVRLYDNWLAGGPTIVEQIRLAVDQKFGIPAQPDKE